MTMNYDDDSYMDSDDDHSDCSSDSYSDSNEFEFQEEDHNTGTINPHFCFEMVGPIQKSKVPQRAIYLERGAGLYFTSFCEVI